ncbi:MAG TPA: hypothetical protein VFE25_13775 [Opitutaceae bacterium]|jgi:hypothetical protein|nr:hypothetical protein [Opitutaceae bacterium]
MSHTLVYATADSRLHADLLIVRLKRAGIPTSLISVLYPSMLRPNSTRCWIRGNMAYETPCGEVTVSGMLGLRLAALKARWSRDPLVNGLTEIGLSHEQSVSVAEKLNGNSIVVAVENADAADLPAIFHTFRGLEIEKVRTADTATISPVLAGRYRRFRRFFEPSGIAFAQANPA